MTDDLRERYEAFKKLDEQRTQGEWEATTCLDVWIEADGKGIAQCGDINWLESDSTVNCQKQMEANGRYIAASPAMFALLTDAMAEIERLREAGKVAFATLQRGKGQLTTFLVKEDFDYAIAALKAAGVAERGKLDDSDFERHMQLIRGYYDENRKNEEFSFVPESEK